MAHEPRARSGAVTHHPEPGRSVLAALEHEGVPQMRTEAELRRWLEGRLTRAHDRAVFDLAPPKSA